MLTLPPPSSYTHTHTHLFLCWLVNVLIIIIVISFAFSSFFYSRFCFIFALAGERITADLTRHKGSKRHLMTWHYSVRLFIQNDYWGVLPEFKSDWLLKKVKKKKVKKKIHFSAFWRKYPTVWRSVSVVELDGVTDEDRSAAGKLWQSEG